MRKLAMALCFALLAGGTLSAQNPGKMPRERWNPEQVAKRTAERLMLDDETSAKFIPLYQEYMQKLAECRLPKKDGNGKNDESDEAIDSRIQAHFSAQEKRLEVQKDYYEKFKGVLTMRQVEQIYERPAFNARMMRPQGAPRQMAPHRR